jgi:hypothetical protein
MKGANSDDEFRDHPSGAKAHVFVAILKYGLKPVPFKTRHRVFHQVL